MAEKTGDGGPHAGAPATGDRIDVKMIAAGTAVACGLLGLLVLGFVALIRYGFFAFIAAQGIAAVLLALFTTVVLPWRRRSRRGPPS